MRNFVTPVFLRYPGGKKKKVKRFFDLLPTSDEIKGRYFEPFLGGGTVFFHIRPKKATLSDLSGDLMDLYRGVKKDPKAVWQKYKSFPEGKKTYYDVRSKELIKADLITRAARTLYLNRTCFKGMWRYNSKGRFNVGYGGEDRRWIITEHDLVMISKLLKGKRLLTSDFEQIINSANEGDYIFLDPPYQPGESEMRNDHYGYMCFSFADQIRLVRCLKKASSRGVKWAITNSGSSEIIELYQDLHLLVLDLSVLESDREERLETMKEVIMTNFIKGG